MHNLPLDFIAGSLLVLVALQGLSVLLANLEIVSKQIEARSNWVAPNGTVFEEFALEQIEKSEVMQHEFEQSRELSFRTS